MQKLINCLIIYMLTLGAAMADPYEDANAALDRNDYKTAFAIVKPLAEQGNLRAMNAMGMSYQMGWGVEANFQIAFEWFRRTAEQGYAPAQVNLGGMYEKGLGVAADMTAAAKWYRIAAEQGYALAQFNMGVLYQTGQGVERDFSEAVKWYQGPGAFFLLMNGRIGHGAAA